jgi:hypothetical protein
MAMAHAWRVRRLTIRASLFASNVRWGTAHNLGQQRAENSASGSAAVWRHSSARQASVSPCGDSRASLNLRLTTMRTAPTRFHSYAHACNSLLSVPWKKTIFPSTKGVALVELPQLGLVPPIPSAETLQSVLSVP